jgi:hypothetical protein
LFSVSLPIALKAEDPTSRLHYKATVTRSGQPASGEIRVVLEGDGSLQPGHSAKELVRETDASGAALITWYRRSIFGRDIKATLTVIAPDDCSTRVEETEAPSNLHTGWRFTVR